MYIFANGSKVYTITVKAELCEGVQDYKWSSVIGYLFDIMKQIGGLALCLLVKK